MLCGNKGDNDEDSDASLALAGPLIINTATSDMHIIFCCCFCNALDWYTYVDI